MIMFEEVQVTTETSLCKHSPSRIIESRMRETIQFDSGIQYGKGTVIRGLSGLVKFFLPSKYSKVSFVPSLFEFADSNLSDLQRTMQNVNKLKDFLYRSKSGQKTLEKFVRYLTDSYHGEFSEAIDTNAAEWAVFASNPNGESYDLQKETERNARFHRLEIFIGEKLQMIINSRAGGVVGIDPIESRSWGMMNIFYEFLQFAQLSREEQLESILSDSGIAILLFCSIFDHISVLMFPIIDLALDCRGRVRLRSDGVLSIEIGDMVISDGEDGLENARLRLRIRLMVLKEAIMVMKPSLLPAGSITLSGKIFLPPLHCEHLEQEGEHNLAPPLPTPSVVCNPNRIF